MTEIERKALELCNEVQAERNHAGSPWNSPTILNEALYRAIERHGAFRQEVSDAVTAFMMDKPGLSGAGITRFIITKPDPLVEMVKDLYLPDEYADRIRATLDALGLEIREKGK